MGGSISNQTYELLQNDQELRSLLDFIETRKAVMTIESFLRPTVLQQALKLEEILLRRRARESERTLPTITDRLAVLTKRVAP
jgi:hypothetical protein